MKKKKFKFAGHPPVASDINEADALIEELWAQLREYEESSLLGEILVIVLCLK